MDFFFIDETLDALVYLVFIAPEVEWDVMLRTSARLLLAVYQILLLLLFKLLIW